MKKLDGTTALKVFASGISQFYENIIADKNLTVDGTTLINSADKIVFNTSYGAPTLSTRSTGTKIVLYPAISSTNLDYSIGVETNDMFFTTEYGTCGYKFYAGINEVASISGGGLITASSLATSGGVIISGDLAIGGVLNTMSFYAAKPWVAMSTTVAVASSPGFNKTGISVSASPVGTYTFTIPTHPRGTNYLVYVSQIATSNTTALALYSTKITSSTSFTVFSKTYLDAGVASDFHVYTVP
jgi:hypothetical protein